MDFGWSFSCEKANSPNKIFETFDIDLYHMEKNNFDLLSNEEHKKYKSFDAFFEEKNSIAVKVLNKEYLKIKEEIDQQLANGIELEVLPVDFIMQEKTMLDVLSSFEDVNYIKDVYKMKKTQVRGTGLNTESATVIMKCIRQGRNLLETGQNSHVLTKPLIDFYAATAYAYALIVINSPLHKSLDSLSKSHGHTYNHRDKIIEFGGDMPRGTFIELLCSIPLAYLDGGNELIITYSLLESIDKIQNHNIKLSLLTMLSMVPELRSYYSKVDNDHKLTHETRIDTKTRGKDVTYTFYIGNGEFKPDLERLKKSFRTEVIKENHGSYEVTLSTDDINKIMPNFYQDIRGDLYYVDSPLDGVVIPEVCLHFLIISALCNIMRYSPHEWSDILNNKVSSAFSLLISRYLRLFEQKFPMMIIQYLSNYRPIMQFQR